MTFAELLQNQPAGTRANGYLNVGNFATGAPILQAYTLLKGAHAGPCLWINGSVHGTEINGIFSAFAFLDGIDPEALRGSVIFTPFANPLAIDVRHKNTPADGQDLDQTFPGNPAGQITDRLSHSVFAAAADCADVAISLHTMGAPFASRPYCVYKLHPESGVSEERLLRFIRHFHPAVACRMPVGAGGSELPGNVAGAVDYQMLGRGKPAFMVELGGGSRVQEDCITQGIAGLNGVASEMGLIDCDVSPAPSILRVTSRRHVMAHAGGLMRPTAMPGQIIPAGEVIGTIHNPHGQVIENIRFDQDVFLIGIRSDPVTHSGDRVAFVASQWDEHQFGQPEAR